MKSYLENTSILLNLSCSEESEMVLFVCILTDNYEFLWETGETGETVWIWFLFYTNKERSTKPHDFVYGACSIETRTTSKSRFWENRKKRFWPQNSEIAYHFYISSKIRGYFKAHPKIKNFYNGTLF